MPALAKHEEISVGPYNVSFDLNTTQDYNITLHPESMENDSSSYMFEITFDNDTKAAIGITEYNNWQYADFPCEFWQRMYLENDPTVQSYSITYPLIDGRRGQMISTTAPRIRDNKTVNSTIVDLWSDSKKIEGYDFLVGKTNVEMILLLPESLIQDLLTTFHMETAQLNETEQLNTKLETKAATGQMPSIQVRTQTGSDPVGIVIIPQVVSRGPSYVVVFDEYGNVLGYEAVADGVNRDVRVSLIQAPKTDRLYATLNAGGATSTKYWRYPFMPDAVVQSDAFSDNRVKGIVSIPPKGSSTTPSWLDTERSTSRMDPYYDRDQCMNNMVANGYPHGVAAFYCD